MAPAAGPTTRDGRLVRLVLCALVAGALLLSVVACGVADWSRSPIHSYGLWRVCSGHSPEVCAWRKLSRLPPFAPCENLLVAARLLSVAGVGALAFGARVVRTVAQRPTASPATLEQATYAVGTGAGLLLLANFLWLGVDSEYQCIFQDPGVWPGTSWYLNLGALAAAAMGAGLLYLMDPRHPLPRLDGPFGRTAARGPSRPTSPITQRLRRWWAWLRRRLPFSADPLHSLSAPRRPRTTVPPPAPPVPIAQPRAPAPSRRA